MGGRSGTHGGEKRYVQNFGWEAEVDHLEVLGRDRRIIQK